jgi:ThiF family/Prokaryotic homologs of the JAB domain
VKRHLFPGDGLEAAALLVCTRTPGPRLRFLVRDVIPVLHAVCIDRQRDTITWPGEYLETAIDHAEPEGLAIILIHSHPGGLFAFSDADDQSDQRVLPCLFQACGDMHGAAIMTPDGAIRARLYRSDMRHQAVELVTASGHDISYWWERDAGLIGRSSRPVAFTSMMTEEIARLTVGVIGVSGTGSIVAEQAARLGFGRVCLIDFDRVERRNLNRILNATIEDADDRRLKVEMFAAAIASHRGEDVAEPLAASVLTREAVLAASQCDVLFCCVDTLEARQVADLVAAAFLIPLIDVGVTIPVRKAGAGVAIADVCGRIDYVQPGRSTLGDRGVYTPESLRAEYLRKAAPDAHRQELEAGYIKGLIEEAPSVITLNMRAAAACVNEFIARAYPFRIEPNSLYARTTFSLAACEEEFAAEESFDISPNPALSRGALEPLLGVPALRAPRKEASS